MLGEQMKQLRDKIDQLNENKKGVKAVKKPTGSKTATKDYDGDGKIESPKDEVWGSRAKAAAKAGKPFQEAAKKMCPGCKKPINLCGCKAKDVKAKKSSKEEIDEFFDNQVTVKGGDARTAGGDTSSGVSGVSSTGGTSGASNSNKNSANASANANAKADANASEGKDKKVKEERSKGTAFDKEHMDAERKKKEGTGKFNKTETPRGTKYTKKADKSQDDDLDEGMKHAKDCDCKECMAVYERDEGKHNNKTTGFKALAKKAGGGEKGARIAGAQREKMKKKHQLENANFRHNVRFVNESLQFLLAEDEEGKAKAITAAGDIVNDFTSWMQRVGQYQTKALIELADAIRADFGAAEAEAFKQAVSPALAQTLEVLTQQREAVSNAVAVLAGEAAQEEPMGMEPDAGMDTGMPAAGPDEMNPEAGADLGDEFAAADASSSNREMRESRVERRARKLAESHSIIAKLSR